MKKKKISIELIAPIFDITLPKHLQKEPQLDFQIDGFATIEAIEIMSRALSSLIINYKNILDQETQKLVEQNKKPN